MRKHLMSILALGAALAVVCAGIATADKPTIVQIGNLKLTLNGGFTPKKLPKKKMAGIKLNVSGKIQNVDGTHPPAMREVVLETDKNGMINAKGVPVCTAGKLQAQDTDHAEKACPKSIVGQGRVIAEIEFAEQRPIDVNSKLLVFNGGVRGGKTTVFIHAFLSNPVSAAIVTKVVVSKIHNGRFGTKSIAKIPVIAGGSGSVKSFNLSIKRDFTYRHKKQHYLLARCPDGHLNAKATSIFDDGSRLTGSFVRKCTGKG